MTYVPNVSVVIPVYNGATWLTESVNSILRQTFSQIEIIVVDDGSTDDTPQILRFLAASDARIHCITKSNSGIADTLNVGIECARGNWICRLDADDLAAPTRIEKQLAFAVRTQSAVLVGSDMISIDSGGTHLKRYTFPTGDRQLKKNLVRGGRFFPHSSAFFQRDVFLQVGGYRSRISKAEDHDLWLRMAQVGSLHSIPEPLVQYRMHAGQISYADNGARQAFDKAVALVSHHLREAGQPDPVNETMEAFDAFEAWVRAEYEESRLTDVFLLSRRVSAAKTRGVLGLASISELFRHPELAARLLSERFGLWSFHRKAAIKWMHAK